MHGGGGTTNVDGISLMPTKCLIKSADYSLSDKKDCATNVAPLSTETGSSGRFCHVEGNTPSERLFIRIYIQDDIYA